MSRVLISHDPYSRREQGRAPAPAELWPGAWAFCAQAGTAPFVAAFRLQFTSERADTVRVHVSADERYELFLDGARVGRGPERGDSENWFFETYALDLSAGAHVLVARVWALGEAAPYAQMSVRPGFLLAAQDDTWQARLGTGAAHWDAKLVSGYTFTDPHPAWGTGANVVVDGTHYPFGVETGAGDGWQAAGIVPKSAGTLAVNDAPPMHRLRPALLPPMRDAAWQNGTVRGVWALESSETCAVPIVLADNLAHEQAQWQTLLRDAVPLTLAPRTRRRVLLDMEDYICAYPSLTVSGGAGSRVRIFWQEALFETACYDVQNGERKGSRDAVDGKYFRSIWAANDGVGDCFLPDGGPNRQFGTLWWQCGRYVEIVVETNDAPLTINALCFDETRYPLEREDTFTASDARLMRLNRMAHRTLQMCAHETYMDCPFYEQLQYVGDTRLQCLTTYATTRDTRLPKKAMEMFGASRLLSGLTQSRYPSRVRQETRPFSLYWVSMLHDLALWRGEPEFVRALLPGARAALDGFAAFLEGKTGLVTLPPGPSFNFVDWVPGWPDGSPPGAANAVVNWQWAMTLRQMSELEAWAGDPNRAPFYRDWAEHHATVTHEAFWNAGRGLYADDPAGQFFSEHAQCMAVLSELLPADCRRRIGDALSTEPGLARATVYFTHYLFDTFHALGLGDALFERLPLWFDMMDMGLCTTVEMPEPARSDCHAWGAHPLFHAHATILGVRPAGFGFGQVTIAPALGPLSFAEGRMPHPNGGEIGVQFTREDGGVRTRIDLPAGVTGRVVWQNQSLSLSSGTQELLLPCPK